MKSYKSLYDDCIDSLIKDDYTDINYSNTEFDTIYRNQPFPYEVSIILKKKDKDTKINQHGSGFNESDPILYFLHNLEYNIIETLPIVKKNKETYRFEVDQELNINMKYNSIYIGAGYNSTAICIKYIKDKPDIECERKANNEPILNKLVLKYKFVKNDSKETNKKKQHSAYIIYRRRKNAKSKFKNSVSECYFYGNDIKKEKY